MKFVDVTNDVAFRRIFTNEHKTAALISFLNAVLDLPDDKKVVEVTILNPYQLPKLTAGKTSIVDVKAKDQNGYTFLVEMQLAEADDFSKRVLYYTSHSYSSQIDRGDFYYKLRPVFFIGILEFELTNNPSYFSRHKVLDVETDENVVKDVEFTFIELPKFNLALEELKTITEQWVYFIKNAENLNIIPESITDEGLKQAFEEADKHAWTKQELEEYDKMFMHEQDLRGRFSLALRRETKRVLTKERTEMAKKLKEKGLDIPFIIETTGLTEEEIEKL